MILQVDRLGKVAVTVDNEYWNSNKDYDKLVITYNPATGASYISRKPVPAGTSYSDTEYWTQLTAETGVITNVEGGVVANSENPISSGAVYIALGNRTELPELVQVIDLEDEQSDPITIVTPAALKRYVKYVPSTRLLTVGKDEVTIPEEYIYYNALDSTITQAWQNDPNIGDYDVNKGFKITLKKLMYIVKNALQDYIGGTGGANYNLPATITQLQEALANAASSGVTYNIASSSTAGLIKIGYNQTGKNYPVQVDANGKAFVTVPWNDTTIKTLFNNTVGDYSQEKISSDNPYTVARMLNEIGRVIAGEYNNDTHEWTIGTEAIQGYDYADLGTISNRLDLIQQILIGNNALTGLTLQGNKYASTANLISLFEDLAIHTGIFNRNNSGKLVINNLGYPSLAEAIDHLHESILSNENLNENYGKIIYVSLRLTPNSSIDKEQIKDLTGITEDMYVMVNEGNEYNLYRTYNDGSNALALEYVEPSHKNIYLVPKAGDILDASSSSGYEGVDIWMYGSDGYYEFYHDDTKQDKLVSGINIKKINGTSLLGSGNITIESGGTTSATFRTGEALSSYDLSEAPIESDDEIPTSGAILRWVLNFFASLSYYTCNSIASSSTKLIADYGIASGYIKSAISGGTFYVKMNYTNTASSVKLKFNDNVNKDLYYKGAAVSSTNTWAAGEIIRVFYDGTRYQSYPVYEKASSGVEDVTYQYSASNGGVLSKTVNGATIDLLKVDVQPTKDSTNSVLSGGVYSEFNKVKAAFAYATCATVASTAAKVANPGINTNNTSDILTGGCMHIKMSYANTASSFATLNIDGTGAKALYYKGARASSTNSWSAGELLTVYFDGSAYQAYPTVPTDIIYTNQPGLGSYSTAPVGQIFYLSYTNEYVVKGTYGGTANKIGYYDFNGNLRYYDNTITEVPRSGTSQQRSSLTDAEATNGFLKVGYQYFDTTLSKPLWYAGSAKWVDATGAFV